MSYKRYMLEVGVTKENEPKVSEIVGEGVECYCTYPDDAQDTPVWCLLTKKEAKTAIRRIVGANIPLTFYKLNVGRLELTNLDVVDLELVELVENPNGSRHGQAGLGRPVAGHASGHRRLVRQAEERSRADLAGDGFSPA